MIGKKVKSRKGMEFAITTLVVIVLAMLILAVLAMALTGTWKKLWNSIRGYSSDSDNLVKICKTQCDLENKQAFCCDEKLFDKEKTNCTDSRLKGDCNINCFEVSC